ncbi:M24 family metallopeptidase [Sediminicola luteus]|uniref:Xaa-Pro aminopeptidase n=1 Tax=Sediminicola luteus TaxID=319238 RepID=A0A2A4G5F1_9FLAO|nr:M24 family metallopeptidase [Sediminicola luteus]PCE63877.1 Xaa-Pro aminopeptidase [Sediminicola luteus]
MKFIYLSLIFFLLTPTLNAQKILPERERAEVVDAVLNERFTHLLPRLMDETGIDMWLVISREYNEDPVIKTMLPATWLNARRRTILLFYRDKAKDTLERLAVARYNVGKNIRSAWDKEKQPDQWQRLMELIQERNPQKIGLNYSTDMNIADGLVKTDYEEFMAVLPKKYHKKVVSAEDLAVRWIETRTPREMVLYQQLAEITHNIIAEAFSTQVITPGVTTTTDVEWWMRQKVTDLGLETWFHPTIDVQRSNESLVNHITSFSNRPEDMVILPGDLLHCDFGISYLNLNTDCQEMAYVLQPTEKEAPAFLKRAFAQGNGVQDALTDQMKIGKTGNQILADALAQAKSAGLQPAIYTHPLSLYGHSAGTTIGMWDSQGGVFKKDGEAWPLQPHTTYAIELNATVDLPEWGRSVRIMLEEAGYVGEKGFEYYIHGRQKELLLIPSNAAHLGQ